MKKLLARFFQKKATTPLEAVEATTPLEAVEFSINDFYYETSTKRSNEVELI